MWRRYQGQYQHERGVLFDGDDDDEAEDSYDVLPESSAGKNHKASYEAESKIKPGIV